MKKKTKKIQYYLIGCMILSCIVNTSCLMLLDAIATGAIIAASSTPRLPWSMGTYTDQFGDRTGDSFIQYTGEVDAIFSNSAYKNEPTKIRELSFSENEGLEFYVIDNHLGYVSSRDTLFNIKLPDETTIEFNGHGQRNRGNNRYMYFIPYSEELLNTLLQENITVRFATSISQCQFVFPPQFKEAYEMLQNRQSEISDNTRLRWSLGDFTDRWGDKTGDSYLQFTGVVSALFSGGGYKSEPTTIGELSFSEKEGLTFYVSDVDLGTIGPTNALFNIILPDETTIEFNGRGQRNSGNNRYMYFIPYSEELLNALLQENIIVHFSTSMKQCTFEFPPRFKEAYELLKNKQ